MGTSGKAVGGVKTGAAAINKEIKGGGGEVNTAVGVAVSERKISLVVKTKGGKKIETIELSNADINSSAKLLKEQTGNRGKGQGRTDHYFVNGTVLSRGELGKFKKQFGITKNPTAKEDIRLPGQQGLLVKRGGKFYHTTAASGQLMAVKVPRKLVPQLVRAGQAFQKVKADKTVKGTKATVSAVKKVMDSGKQEGSVGTIRGSKTGKSPDFTVQARRAGRKSGAGTTPDFKPGPRDRELSRTKNPKTGKQVARGPRKGTRRGVGKSGVSEEQSARAAKKATKKRTAKRRAKKKKKS